MFIKTGISKFEVQDIFPSLEKFTSFIKTARKGDATAILKKIANYEPIQANPQDYLYIRNRSISAEETYGPNQNWDAFPSEELVKAHRTFINTPITVDHINTGQDSEVIGIVLDSVYVPKQLYKPNSGQLMAFSENLAAKNDQIIGDWVENLWAIDKKRAAQHTPGLVEGILNGEITDSSMGTSVETSKCSICANVATDSDSYCEHIREGKGQFFEVNGVKRIAYEKNYGLNFFEDTLIISDAFAKKAGTKASAGGEGADAGAKILEVIASKSNEKSILSYVKRATPMMQFSEDVVEVGTPPSDYVQSKEKLDEEKEQKKKKDNEEYNEEVLEEEEGGMMKHSTDSLVRKVKSLTSLVTANLEKELTYSNLKRDIKKLSAVLGSSYPQTKSFTRPVPMGNVVAPYNGFTKSYGTGPEYGRIMDELKSTYRDLEVEDPNDTISIDEVGRVAEKIMEKLDIDTEFLDEVTSYIIKYFGMEDMDKEASKKATKSGLLKSACFMDKLDAEEILGALGQDETTFTAPLTGSSEGAYGTVHFFYVETDSSFRLNFESSEEAEHAFEYLSEHYGDLFSISSRFDMMPTVIMIQEFNEDPDILTMTLFSKVKELRGRMNQPNIDEKIESQETLRETYKFDRADQIPKGVPHYDSQEMPYTVNDKKALLDTLGGFESKVASSIETLSIERGINKDSFFYTTANLKQDTLAAFHEDRELHKALEQQGLKKAEVLKELPSMLNRIQGVLESKGWKITPSLAYVKIGADLFNPGDSITIVNKDGTSPEDEGNVEEVGVQKGEDGNDYPAVKINNTWYSQEGYNINKNSTKQNQIDHLKALKQLDTISLFEDGLVETSKAESETSSIPLEVELASVFASDTRRVKQAKRLLQQRYKSKGDEQAISGTPNVEVSLDNGNFFS